MYKTKIINKKVISLELNLKINLYSTASDHKIIIRSSFIKTSKIYKFAFIKQFKSWSWFFLIDYGVLKQEESWLNFSIINHNTTIIATKQIKVCTS